MFSISRWLFQRPGVAARAGPGGAWRPAPARWPCGGPRRGSPRGFAPACSPGADIPRWGSDVGGVKGGGHRPDALGGRPTAAIPIVRVRRRRKPLGGRRGRGPAAMFRALPKEIARGGLCGPDCQPGTPPGRPGLGYRADVPICVPMPRGHGNREHRSARALRRRNPRGLARGRPAAGPRARQPARGPLRRAARPRWAASARTTGRSTSDSAMQHEARTTAAFRWSSVRIENLGCRLLARRLNVATSSCGQPGRASLVAARVARRGRYGCLRDAGRLGLGHTIMGPPEVVDSQPRPRDYSPCARPR
jgi:hypothetical protein